jgi:hypothetical protein
MHPRASAKFVGYRVMLRKLIPGLLAFCASAAALAQEASAASPYAVDGVTLAKSMLLPREYQCSPSEQFAQYLWCRRSRQEKGKQGAFTATTSVLRDPGRTVTYVSRDIKPAFFADDDVEAEVKRLSSRLGAPVREIRLPKREGAPDAVIVLWGKLELQEVSKTEQAGGSDQTMLVDHLGDVQQSRRLGLPVYRLAGGSGYLWSASNRNGRGHLRFLAADPAALAEPAEEAAPARTKELAAQPSKQAAAVVPAAKEAAPVAPATKYSTSSISAKDLRPFLAPQQTAMLAGDVGTQPASPSKDSSWQTIAQKTRADADHARIMDAERAAAEERENARLAWARFEAEKAAQDRRTRLLWTVISAFFILTAILKLLQMIKRREEKIALPDAPIEPREDDKAGIRAWVERERALLSAGLRRLRGSLGSRYPVAAR